MSHSMAQHAPAVPAAGPPHPHIGACNAHILSFPVLPQLNSASVVSYLPSFSAGVQAHSLPTACPQALCLPSHSPISISCIFPLPFVPSACCSFSHPTRRKPAVQLPFFALRLVQSPATPHHILQPRATRHATTYHDTSPYSLAATVISPQGAIGQQNRNRGRSKYVASIEEEVGEAGLAVWTG